MGTTPFMLALYDHPQANKAFMARLADWIVDIIGRAARAGADIVYLQDDYSSTGRPLISPKMWREFTLPHLKRMVAAAHEAGVPFMLHSCGYQMPFLADYVEAGIDALQSFQPKAGNDLAAAYAQVGDRLAFATGIDVQQGEWMSPQELRADILHSYELAKRGGRHILSMTHMMQYTMPAANIRAILDTVAEIQSGHPKFRPGSSDEEEVQAQDREQGPHHVLSARIVPARDWAKDRAGGQSQDHPTGRCA